MNYSFPTAALAVGALPVPGCGPVGPAAPMGPLAPQNRESARPVGAQHHERLRNGASRFAGDSCEARHGLQLFDSRLRVSDYSRSQVESSAERWRVADRRTSGRINTTPRRGCYRPGLSRGMEILMQTDRTPTPGPLTALARGQVAAAGLTDARGYKRTPATTAAFHVGSVPRNKGRQYPPDPPSVEETVALLEACPDTHAGQRLRATIIVLWRAGLRVSEALALTEHDLDEREHTVTVRCGKGGKRRLCGMDAWGWQHLHPWLEIRRELPVGALFCVVSGPTAGRAMGDSDVRHALHKLGATAGVRRRIAPHQFRHAHAVELARDGIGLHIVSRQLGHANLAITSTYMQGIAPTEVIDAVASRRPPMVTALHMGATR